MSKSPWTWVVVCWTSFLEGEDSKAAFVMQRETMAMASVCSRRKPLQHYFPRYICRDAAVHAAVKRKPLPSSVCLRVYHTGCSRPPPLCVRMVPHVRSARRWFNPDLSD